MGLEYSRESQPQPFDLTHHETLAELRSLPDTELERRHDAVVRALTDDSVSSAQQS